MPRAATAWLLAFLALWPAGCGSKRDARAVARDLVETAEAMAEVVASAQTIEDLKASQDRLQELIRRTKALDRETRRMAKPQAEVSAEFGARLNAALKRITDTRAAWATAGKTDMIRFVDSLRDR